jgi:hypothetical protein
VLTPGRSHVVTTSPGNIEVVGIHAPGGLDLRGKTTQPPITAEMPGYDVRNKGSRVHIKRDGPNLATLTLDAVGRLSIKG